MNYLEKIVLEGIKNVGFTDFFNGKGYSDATIKKYMLGYLPKGLCEYANYIDEEQMVLACYKYLIPEISQDNEIIYTISRVDNNTANISLSFEVDKHYFIGASDRVIWNRRALFQEYPVFICETWTDALSVIDCGFEAVALNRIVNIVDLWKVIKNVNNNKYVLFGDNDYFGKKANYNMARMLKSMSLKFTCVEHFPDGIKDANEWMLYDRVNFEETLRRKYNELL